MLATHARYPASSPRALCTLWLPMPSFDLARFHERLSTRAFGRNLVFRPSVGSTMDLARDAAQHGAPEGTLALADEQTAGRGRRGRGWITPPAVNLASTLVLRPPPHVFREIAMITPLAVCLAVEQQVPLRCDIKWPNDVQVGGKKLAGVLIESVSVVDQQRSASGASATLLPAQDGAFVLVGTGINVNFDPRQYDEIRDIATSVAAETGHEADREALLAAYLAHFERLYDSAKSGASPFDEWRARLVTLGRRVHATSPSGAVEGTAEGVTAAGALIVRTQKNTTVAIEAGDVTLRE